MSRPRVITFLSLFYLVAALFSAYFIRLDTKDVFAVAVTGYLAHAVRAFYTALFLLLAYGLWTMREWVRWLAIGFNSYAIVNLTLLFINPSNRTWYQEVATQNDLSYPFTVVLVFIVLGLLSICHGSVIVVLIRKAAFVRPK